MIRSVCACLAAALILFTSTSGAMAASWRNMYNMESDPLYGLLDENEMAGMAYLKVPFGGPLSKRNDATWGLSVLSRMPYELNHVRLGSRSGIATVFDLQFNGSQVRDLQINGLSARQSFRQLNAVGDQRSSPWVTYGIMALALGAAVGVVILASGDEDNVIERVPGRANNLGIGCGDGMGPGAGNGTGNGDLGETDPREFNNATRDCTPADPGDGDGGGDGGGS